jgi:hypothetical protein
MNFVVSLHDDNGGVINVQQQKTRQAYIELQLLQRTQVSHSGLLTAIKLLIQR